jgi:hypothetical protein
LTSADTIPTDFDFPAGESITSIPAAGDPLRTEEPPTAAFLTSGLACFGILGLLRRFRVGVNSSRQHGEGN